MFQTILISNNRYVAKNAGKLFLDSIMVDLETDGKIERQKDRNAFLSSHTWDDVIDIAHDRDTGSELIVRINPYSDKTQSELQRLTALDINYVMLPMIQSLKHISETMSIIKNTDAAFELLPLVEHIDGLNVLASILDKYPDIRTVFFGLNDLSISLGLPFLFQCISHNYIDRGAEICKSRGVKFGFGGVGMIGGDDTVAAELILSEHARTGSSSAILSRSFRNKFAFLHGRDREPSFEETQSFKNEVAKLKKHHRDCTTLTEGELLSGRKMLDRAIEMSSAEKLSIPKTATERCSDG